jgi:hypothetical protein
MLWRVGHTATQTQCTVCSEDQKCNWRCNSLALNKEHELSILHAPLVCYAVNGRASCAGLVETSNNLASVAPLDDGKTYQIVQTTRSSIGAALTAQRKRIARLGRLAGADVNQNDAYPGSQPQ